MKKRGSSQVDWAISLAMFLLYLGWFFILAKPQMIRDSDAQSITDDLMSTIIENATWTVTKVPFFIYTNRSEAFDPIVIDFPFDWENGSFAFVPGLAFTRFDGKVYTTKTTDGNTFILEVIHSDDSYDSTFFSKDLESDDTFVRISGKGFEANILDGIVTTVDYFGSDKIREFDLYSNGILVNVTNSTYIGGNTVAIYRVVTDLFNQTMTVFPENARMFFDYSKRYDIESTMTLSFKFDNYKYYFADPDHWASLNYSYPTCYNASGDFVDLYSALEGFALMCDSSMDIYLCTTNESEIVMNASITSDEDIELYWLFHEDDYNEVLNFSKPVHTSTGVASKLSGISLDRLDALKGIEYGELRDQLDFPGNMQFSIRLRNSTGDDVFSYSDPIPLETDDVVVKSSRVFVLDKDGVLSPHTLMVNVW